MATTADIAGFLSSVRPDDVTQGAVEIIEASILDGLGCMLLGCSDPSIEHLLASGVARITPTGCAVIGRDVRAGPLDAALLNSTACRSREYDDVCSAAAGGCHHPTAVILPAALAACEEKGGSGNDLIAAYLAGFETAAWAGRIFRPTTPEQGWTVASLLGALGAAAAGARAYDLDPSGTATALGLAATLAPGLGPGCDPLWGPLQTGWTARAGLAAARLALAGMEAPGDVRDAPFGLPVAIGRDSVELPSEGTTGHPLWIERAGIALRGYPCAEAAQTVIEAALEVRSSEGFRHQDVVEVICRVAPVVPSILTYSEPRTLGQARHSLPFCIAAALVEGRVGIDTFASRQWKRPSIRRLMPLVRMDAQGEVSKPAAPRDPPERSSEASPGSPSVLRVRLKDGRWIERCVLAQRGMPERPFTPAERHKKFREMASASYPPEIAEEIIVIVENLSREKNLIALLKLVGS